MKWWGKAIIISISVTLAFSLASAQQSAGNNGQAGESTQWLTIQELNQMVNKKNWKRKKRKIIIDLYTDWCGWCKRMDKNTFRNPEISEYINQHYYAVKFNAETRDSIEFGNKTWYYHKSPGARRGTNTLAIALGNVNGRLGYPTLVILNEDLQLIQALPGYKTVDQLMPILVYFAENHHFDTPWADFLKEYQNRQSGNGSSNN